MVSHIRFAVSDKFFEIKLANHNVYTLVHAHSSEMFGKLRLYSLHSWVCSSSSHVPPFPCQALAAGSLLIFGFFSSLLFW